MFMKNAIIALILSCVGIALLFLLGGGLLGCIAAGFFVVCAIITLWLGVQDREKEDYNQKVEKLEERVEELESKENVNNFNYCDNCGKALSQAFEFCPFCANPLKP